MQSRKPFFHRREEALRHRAAYDPLGKFQRIAVARLEFDPHITELSVAAGLLLVPPLDGNLFPNGLAVSDLRLFQGNLHAEFTL